jgi:plasmid stabilization system protein ParE
LFFTPTHSEIWKKFGSTSHRAASTPPTVVREEIYDAIQSLVPFPYSGHSRPDLTGRPLRFQTVREYVIIYAPDEKPLAIVAIVHGRRNPRVIAAILHKRS